MAKKPKMSQKRGFIRRVGGDGPWPVRTLRWLVALLITGGLAGVLLVVGLYFMVEIPDPNKDFQTQTTNVFYSDGKSQIGSFSNQDRRSISIDEIPDVMRNAVVAAEDRSFWSNRGIDIRGIVRAARNNTQAGEITGGGSTITQQYVKILYLTQERTYTRKIKEVLLSIKIHNQLSKEQILEGYLNTIYFGNGAYGVEVAAQTYFGIPASELNASQAAYLATVINNPTKYDPFTDGARDRILPRYNYVVNGMVESRAITASEGSEIRGTLPKFKKQKKDQRYAGTKGFLLDLTKRKMLENGFNEFEIVGGGYKIVTTFDKDMQKAAVSAVKEVRPSGIPEVNTALASVEVGTGALRAMYGGPDFLKSQLNWAMLGTQPGSTFKVFAVVAGLRDGFSLQTRLYGNSPIEIGKDKVSNAGDNRGQSFGTVSLAKATQSSVNTAFIDLTRMMSVESTGTTTESSITDLTVGAQKILTAARDAGIPQSTIDKINPVMGVSLGYAPIAPVDMATSYATLAAEGNRADWYAIESVLSPTGASLYKHSASTTQTIDPDIASDTIASLQLVTKSGTGTRGRTFCPTAGKTGTATAGTQANSRVSGSWFVGTTPKLATAVMYNRGVGNEQLEGYLSPYYGGTYPAMTFRKYSEAVLDRNDCGKFAKPANLKATKGVEIKKDTKPRKTKATPEPTVTLPTDPTPTPEPEPTPTLPTVPTPTVPTVPSPTLPPAPAPPPAPGLGLD